MPRPQPRPGHVSGTTHECLVFHGLRALSSAFGVSLGAPMESTGRLFLCACCREQVLICRRCDRGQRYCRCCAQEVRRAKMREAGRRYQKSRQGRFAHAARSRRHRERREKVTHQGSLPLAIGVVLRQDSTDVVATSVPPDAASSLCQWCARPLPPFVRTGPLRRRGPRPVYRFDCGGPVYDDIERVGSAHRAPVPC